jgi:hypothetical protein
MDCPSDIQHSVHLGPKPGLRFTEALFEHVGEHRDLYNALVGRQSGAIVLREFQRMYVSLVRRDLESLAPHGPKVPICWMVVTFISGALLQSCRIG